ALYRPGPMEHITTYIDAKHQRAAIRYPHPALRELLEDTYGVIVYQDQVLLIVQAFAGYSLGEADVVRKAMGKKIPAVMRQEQQRFVRGALARGFTAEEAEAVFHLIEPFAGYAFNKAHSVSYALIAYWTAYFKANYPLEYMASVLNTRLGSLERAATAVAECHRLGIPVLPPDVNRSDVGFTIEGQPDGGRSIRFGLAAVKNVGMAWVRPVTEARLQGGPFRSIDDFCRRAELSGANRRGLESLIKVGAFDALGVERSSLLAGLDRFLSLAQREARLRRSGQATMFDLLGQTVEAPLPQLDLPPKEPPSPREKVAWERELLGVALSDNPFGQELASLGGSGAILSVHDLDPAQSGQRVVLLGQLASVRQGFTRERRPFIAAMVALLGGEVEVVAWPNVLETSQELWVEGAALWIIGRIRMREERLTVVCEEVKPYHPQEELPYPEPEPASRTAPRSPQEDTNGRVDGEPQATLLLTIQETENAQKDEQRLREVLRVLLEFPGQDRVLLEVQGKNRKVRLDAQITTGSSPELLARLEEVLEPGTMRIEELA
ncbi:MAG: DNA polymerase III subunit alpha, partial [Chloroflexi bacterium]|nr:DNA polymerase III subunit alpha [Chloroflexota bacterium]